MVISTRNSPKCEIRFGDVRVKHGQTLNSMQNAIRENEKYDTEIRNFIGIANGAFKKLNQLLTYRSIQCY